MAASGLLLIGFVIAHLLGNLLVFAGPGSLNAYAKKLRDWGGLLWAARVSLLAALVVHVWASIRLAAENRAARPVRYHATYPTQTTWAARTMLLSGLLMAGYLVYHLLHMTFRITNPDISHATDALGRHDVYSMVVWSFRHRAIALAYVLGVGLLCFHLSHGMASAFQTLGLTTERTIPLIGHASRIMAIAVFIGYASIPLAVLFGWLRPIGHSP